MPGEALTKGCVFCYRVSWCRDRKKAKAKILLSFLNATMPISLAFHTLQDLCLSAPATAEPSVIATMDDTSQPALLRVDLACRLQYVFQHQKIPDETLNQELQSFFSEIIDTLPDGEALSKVALSLSAGVDSPNFTVGERPFRANQVTIVALNHALARIPYINTVTKEADGKTFVTGPDSVVVIRTALQKLGQDVPPLSITDRSSLPSLDTKP